MHACETLGSLPQISFLQEGRLCSLGLRYGPHKCLLFWAGNTGWLAGLGHPEGVAQWLYLLSWKLHGGHCSISMHPWGFLALPLSPTINVP